MEFSLHRALKEHYAGPDALTEVPLAGYRVDAVRPNLLIEIQHGSLGAIRQKIARLVESHNVLVVKPVVMRKTLVQQTRRGGDVRSRRLSPKRGQLCDVFQDLVHFTQVFPHPRLTLEVALVEVEEWRYPGHGRRRRRRVNDFQVEDQRLVQIHQTHVVRQAADLLTLLGAPLPATFHTGELAELLNIPRWLAQKVAYCLREAGAVEAVGKQGNAWVYRLPKRRRKRVA